MNTFANLGKMRESLHEEMVSLNQSAQTMDNDRNQQAAIGYRMALEKIQEANQCLQWAQLAIRDGDRHAGFETEQ